MSEASEGWCHTTLGQLGDYLNGRGFKKTEWRSSGRPIIRIQNLTGSSSEFNYFQGEALDQHVARPGDLLVSWAATLGAYFWNGPEAVVNQHIFKVDSRIDKRFHKYLLDSKLNELMGQTHGSGMVHITRSKFDHIPVWLPPRGEQERIVAILEEHLTDLDDAAAGLRGAGAKSTAMVAAARRTAVERAAEVGEPSTVGQRAILVDYGTSRKTHEDPAEGDIPVLRMGNVQDGRLKFAPLKYLPPAAPGVRNLVLKRGDLLFNRTNSAELVGKSAVFEADIEATFASYLIRVRFNSSVRPEWANIVVNSPQGRAYITAIASQQVGQANVNGTKLKAFPLPVPSLTDQDEFIQSFRKFESAAERLRAQTDRSLARTASLRRAVLQAAFSGRLTGRGSDTDVIEEAAEEESA